MFNDFQEQWKILQDPEAPADKIAAACAAALASYDAHHKVTPQGLATLAVESP